MENIFACVRMGHGWQVVAAIRRLADLLQNVSVFFESCYQSCSKNGENGKMSVQGNKYTGKESSGSTISLQSIGNVSIGDTISLQSIGSTIDQTSIGSKSIGDTTMYMGEKVESAIDEFLRRLPGCIIKVILVNICYLLLYYAF